MYSDTGSVGDPSQSLTQWAVSPLQCEALLNNSTNGLFGMSAKPVLIQ